MTLVLAKQHVFCRWDGDGERFNIEGASNGGVNYYPDEHYRTWPRPISDEELATGEFLRSLTPPEEVALFLLNRGACLQANGKLPQARLAYAQAHALMPDAITPQRALWWATRTVVDESRRSAAGAGMPRTAAVPPVTGTGTGQARVSAEGYPRD